MSDFIQGDKYKETDTCVSMHRKEEKKAFCSLRAGEKNKK